MNIIMDFRTLIFVAGIIFLSLSITVLYVFFSGKTYQGFIKFIIATLIGSAGLILLSYKGIINDFFSMVLANTLLIAYMVFISFGIDVYAGSRKSSWFYAVPILFIFTVNTLIQFFPNEIDFRTLVMAFTGITICVYTIITLNRNSITLGGKNWFMIVTMGILTAWFTARILCVFLYHGINAELMQSPRQRIALFIYIICAVNLTIGIILINAKKIENDLVHSIADVRILRGILPICSSCKKIRDDAGYWNQLEFYIQSHTTAEFSHGLCPDCVKKLYGNQEWYKK